ncbi:MAG TPA: PQQ-binding-like beta-propeller repeat protein [Vicinamibacterales bacterium]|nr:PQQ-binding-like beta-propeller repeat protein [Vicinamibacterales bacterium]
MKRVSMILAATLAVMTIGPASAQNNWVGFGQDPGATKFSTLDQINVDNVKSLKRAWTFHTGDDSGFFESGLLVVDGVMYFSAQNGVFALDAATGQQIWKYETTGTARRGPLYWPGGSGVGPRIFSQVEGGMAAIDPKDGKLITAFGDKGIVPGLRMTSPPAAYKNVIMTQGGNSTVKAWDAVTGEARWTLNLKAQPGDPAADTWLGDSLKTAGGPGLWGYFSVDVERGLLYVPVEKVGNDYWGGPHHGNNLYSDCLLAVDVNTGKIKWYQQLVHHDIWDFDLAAPPALVDVTRGGRTIPGVSLITKMGIMFVFNRETGEPMYGMEERPVPQTTARGEWTSPTQPFPLKPEPLARMSIKKSELAKVTPELEAHCKGLWEKYNLSDSVPYTPWKEKQDIVLFPGAVGGGNWQGVMVNKTLGLMITNVHNTGQWGHLEERQPGAGGGRGGGRGGRGGDAAAAGAGAAGAGAAGAGAAGAGAAGRGGRGAEPPDLPANVVAPGASSVPNMSKVTPEGGRFWDAEHKYSCAEPPWGELIAVSANTGDIAWRIPLGEYPELIAKGLKPTGAPSLGGGITTAGNLIFIGATIDGIFRAIDARNGKELWREKLEAPAHSIPSTYLGKDGKQYIAVPAGGGGFLRSPTSDAVIAWRVQ